MKKTLIVLLLLFPAVVFAGDCPKNQAYVSADKYGDEWPFTVTEGCLQCKSNAIVMHSGGKTYNINGKAIGRYKNRYTDSWKILKPHPNKIVAEGGGKMNVRPIIKEGLKLCSPK